ncbi:MAG: ThuA domain-containing protein [Candidatus Aminicenantes bacterium]|nr:ThuA domain-containing protein [Candidatus Aminicenantes bacterium]
MKSLKPLSRRSAIRDMGLIGAASALGPALSPLRIWAGNRKSGASQRSIRQTGARRADVFALVGDRWHSFDYIRTAFTRTLVNESGVTVTFTPDSGLLTEETLAAHRLLLILCDGMIFPGGYTSPYPFMDPEKIRIVSEPPLPKFDEQPQMWITPEQGRAIRRFVEGGGSAWFFHNASYISGANEDFRHVEGALFTGHTPFRPYKMKVVNRDHPITRGVSDFVVTEEQHYVIYDKDPQDVLVRSVNEEGLEFKTDNYGNQGATCEACWAYEYGKGRVCFMAPGHTIPSLWNPEYVKLQKNALRWLLRET